MQQLQVSTAIDAVVAIVAFGILLSVVHEAPQGMRAPTPTEWVVITAAIVAPNDVFSFDVELDVEAISRLAVAVGLVALHARGGEDLLAPGAASAASKDKMVAFIRHSF